MRQFRADLLARDGQQMSEMVRRWRAVEDALQARIELLAQRAADMQANGQPVTAALLARDARFKELMAQANVEIDKFLRWSDGNITDQQATYARLGLESSVEAINLSTDYAFNALPVSAVENMVGLAGDGSPLMALLREAWPTAADGLMTELVNATAQGMNPGATARAMSDGLSQGLDRCMTIARTEQLRVFREANRQQMVESGIVTGYKRVSAKDLRVCAACLFADGMVFDLEIEFAEHPNGRCLAVPVIRGQAAPSWEYGPAWFMKQSEADQSSILGPTRFDLWKANQVSLRDMVSVTNDPTWGPTIGVTSISNLGG